jgi:hypothetical protein
MTMDYLRTLMAVTDELIEVNDAYHSGKLSDAGYCLTVKKLIMKIEAAKSTEAVQPSTSL